MAKTKAEMEEDRARYHELVAHARSMIRDGRFNEAIKIAAAAWKHIDGMMQFERKYENKEFSNIEAIDIVLEYAPLLFEFVVLDELEALLKAQRKIDRDASDDLAGNLSKARDRMWAAHRLWNHLEVHRNAKIVELGSALGGTQDIWRALVEAWETMGVIRRTGKDDAHFWTLTTQMNAMVLAKCPACGGGAKWNKAKFLETLECPTCRKPGSFVLLARESAP